MVTVTLKGFKDDSKIKVIKEVKRIMSENDPKFNLASVRGPDVAQPCAIIPTLPQFVSIIRSRTCHNEDWAWSRLCSAETPEPLTPPTTPPHPPHVRSVSQAKKFVESTPQKLKEDISKEDADKLVEVLEAAGAEIEVK
jgi:hypothetical protein